MKTTRVRLVKMVVAVIFLLQLLPLNWVAAISPTDLTNSTYLVVHGTDYAPPDRASSLKITQADGVTVIPPSANGEYNDIPAGAKIMLNYAFHLEDGNGTELYDYTGDEYFTAELPQGLDFAAATGTVDAFDSTGNYTYTLAAWSITGHTLTVSLTSGAEDLSGHGGAANDAHLDKWGMVHIEGTFQPLNAGGGTATEVRFGSEVIVINRQPLPMESTLSKDGRYDASDNTITWTVTVTPPAGAPDMAYDGYSLIDEFGPGQTYVADSFAVGGTSISDSALDTSRLSTDRIITYTFPDTDPDITGVQTITYKTSPNDFSAENGSSASSQYSEFINTASLKRGADDAADPVTYPVRLDWIEKNGALAATTSDPTIAQWTVTVAVPGDIGKAISGAAITDSIAPDLELLADTDHPVQIKFGSAAAADVDSGGDAGQYEYSGNTLTYRFPTASQPTAGTTATLTFYTRVKPASRDHYLNSNDAISFNNGASLTWNHSTTSAAPSDTAAIANGIGAGGLLSKSSAGGTTPYAYSVTDPGTIHWTITVNRNKIGIKKAAITDIIPSGQTLLIDAGHAFTVTEKGSSDTSIYRNDGATINPNGGVFAVTPTGFSYEFPDEDPGDGLDDTIKNTYTVDYYTRVVDTVPGTPGDSSGLDTLYKNGDVSFDNGVTLTRTGGGGSIYTSGTKTYSGQMLDKTVATAYDYNTRTVQWQLVVNRNRLPLTDAVVTDTIPSGMTLFIDAGHPFTVTAAGGGATGTLAGANGDTAFTYTLPVSTSDQYTITFWTLMDESTLKTQWSGTRPFTNSASLGADEITISDNATAQVKNPVISKTYHYTSGSDHIDWSAVINPGQVLLTDGVVKDVLDPKLRLDPASVKLYEVSINSSDGTVAGTVGEVSASDYVITLPTADNSNTLSVELPKSTTAAYRLEFTTSILSDDLDLTNTITLSGSAGDPSGGAVSSQIVITDLYSNGGSGSNTLTVHKMDAHGNPLSGATFRLLNINKQPVTSGGSPIIRTTNPSGDAVFDKLPSWTFYVEETEPALGYILPADPISGGSQLNGSATLSISNDPALGSISFAKTSTNGSPLSGGTFTLTGTDYAGNAVAVTATSVAGTVTFTDVPLGTNYAIRETIPPAGYKGSDTVLTASVSYNADKTGVVTNVSPNTLSNEPLPGPATIYGNIEITKTDEDGHRLAGATFALYRQSNGGLVATAVSDSQGLARFSNVPVERYVIRETAAPEGYVLSADTIDVNVTNTATLTFTVTNKADASLSGNIRILKTDDAGNALEGGEFTLYDANGKALKSVVTGPDGRAVFDSVQAGPYTVSETRAPAGYAADTDSAAVTVISGQSSSLTFINRKISADAGSIQIKKVDKDSHPLSGAEFTLYDESGAAIGIAISGEDGLALFEGVAPGRYSVRETAAPDGYELFAEPLPLDIGAGQTLAYTLRNNLLTDEDSGVLGWSGNDTPAPGGTLPQTGGISGTFYFLISGLALLAAGLLTAKPKKHRRKSKTQDV
ncbi:LPXTG-motif cell wall anchor domain-containing protein [Sporobacter termitidis DSM 10068]|uniref:LPXTG-motif cell wall anchor domain-containing protein n=1 Tax=Sporobacter termitidis DSM 10068 TaxID=1123282 RepID=A0A1M5YR54_9FIRM|nr:SpaA isopeptide-forming pilin-related protein [Sporobacter termitidis]SHI14340.1 LPXTG-motif cell wall anchor domain-containing protein [Sporobacter termitidis DSM 10068]